MCILLYTIVTYGDYSWWACTSGLNHWLIFDFFCLMMVHAAGFVGKLQRVWDSAVRGFIGSTTIVRHPLQWVWMHISPCSWRYDYSIYHNPLTMAHISHHWIFPVKLHWPDEVGKILQVELLSQTQRARKSQSVRLTVSQDPAKRIGCCINSNN